MKLMLGWEWPQAVDYARDRGWTIYHNQHMLKREDGVLVAVVRGEYWWDTNAIRGVEFDEIVEGPMRVDPELARVARLRVRRAGAEVR